MLALGRFLMRQTPPRPTHDSGELSNEISVTECRCYRIAAFWDPGWFSLVNRFFMKDHPAQAHINVTGIHDAIRLYVHERFDVPMIEISVSEAHSMRTADARHSVGGTMAINGIRSHVTADTNYCRARQEFCPIIHERVNEIEPDMVALLVGHIEFTSLAKQLTAKGMRVLVPDFRETVSSQHPRPERRVETSLSLRQAASDKPTYEELLTRASESDQILALPFLPPSRWKSPQGSNDDGGQS